jgi:hypothetical protein
MRYVMLCSPARRKAGGRSWPNTKTRLVLHKAAGEGCAGAIPAVLTERDGRARPIATYEPLESDTTSYGPAFRQQLVGNRTRFLGDKPEVPGNPKTRLKSQTSKRTSLNGAGTAASDRHLPVHTDAMETRAHRRSTPKQVLHRVT